MTAKQNKKTDSKGGPESRESEKGGRERAGEKSVRQPQRNDEGQLAGKRSKLDDPERKSGPTAAWDEDAETDDGSEVFPKEDEDEEGAIDRQPAEKPAGRRPKDGS